MTTGTVYVTVLSREVTSFGGIRCPQTMRTGSGQKSSVGGKTKKGARLLAGKTSCAASREVSGRGGTVDSRADKHWTLIMEIDKRKVNDQRNGPCNIIWSASPSGKHDNAYTRISTYGPDAWNTETHRHRHTHSHRHTHTHTHTHTYTHARTHKRMQTHTHTHTHTFSHARTHTLPERERDRERFHTTMALHDI